MYTVVTNVYGNETRAKSSSRHAETVFRVVKAANNLDRPVIEFSFDDEPGGDVRIDVVFDIFNKDNEPIGTGYITK